MATQNETPWTESLSGSGDKLSSRLDPCAGEGKTEGARRQYVNSAVEQTGKVLKALSQKVRLAADSLRQESGPKKRVGKTVERVAATLESSADYLTASSSDTIQEDLTGVVKRHPMRTLGVCFGVGLLLGAVLRRPRA